MISDSDAATIENAIRDFLLPFGTDSLSIPIEYLLKHGGKRLRPAALLMGTRMFGGNQKDALPGAVAVELFHNFSLMHDDIMDNAPIRRGNPTVHYKWNVPQAILSGDALMVQAYMSLNKSQPEFRDELTDLFNQTAYEVCLGQQMDMDFEQRSQVSEVEYLEMIRLKTSVLLGAAFQMGAIVARAPKVDANHIYAFGVQLGMAFQLRDDYLDSFGEAELTGKQVGGDILGEKKTYLAIRAAQKHGGPLPSKLGTTNEDHIRNIQSLYREYEADIDLLKMSDYYFEAAINRLDSIALEDQAKEELRCKAKELIQRKH